MLQRRKIDEGLRIFAESVILAISYYTNDFVILAQTIEAHLAKPLTDGIYIGPNPPRCCFVDDGNTGRFLAVIFREFPSTQNWNSQRWKIAWPT